MMMMMMMKIIDMSRTNCSNRNTEIVEMKGTYPEYYFGAIVP